MEVSCYDMDLYCDQASVKHPFDSFPQQFTGANRADAARKAKERGWRFHRNNTVSCPRCKHLPPPDCVDENYGYRE